MNERFEQEREEEERLLPSEKRFGWSFSGVFGVVAVWGLWKGHFLLAGIGGSLSVLFSVVSIVAPERLRGLNRGWLRFGLLLERVVRPVVVTAIFLLVITPVAVVTRLFGRDALRLKKKQRETYWIEREGGMPSAQSFKNQF